METIFENWLTQFIATVGIIYLFGLAVWALNKAFYSMLGGRAHGFCIFTGAIGTPVHEIGHAIFCLIFGHKIVDMKLFTPHATDGTLGYVSHSYNKRNIYHQIGNFFIGVGPVLFGSAVLLFLMYLLAPDMFDAVRDGIGSSSTLSFGAVKDAVVDIFKAVFNTADFENIRQWVFLVLAVFITLHMSLSPADMKGSVRGTIYIAVLLLLVNVVLYLISKSVQRSFTSLLVGFGLAAAGFLSIAVVVAAAVALIGLVIRLITKVLGR